MRKLIWVIAVTTAALMCSVTIVRADDLKVGDPMPDLGIGQLFSPPGYSIDPKDLHGFVTVVMVCRSDSGIARDDFGVQRDFQEVPEPGGVIIGLTEEKPDVIAAFLLKTKVDYFIGSLSGSNGTFKSESYPFSYVFNSDGRLTWSGRSLVDLQNQVEKTLRDKPATRNLGGGADANTLIMTVTEGFLKAGQTQEAMSAFRHIDQESLAKTEGQKERYTGLQAQLTTLAKATMDKAAASEKAEADGWLYAYQQVAEFYAGLPIADEASAAAKRLEGSPEVAAAQRSEINERLAGNALRRATDLASSGDDVAAYEKAKLIIAKYGNTKAAADARAMVTKYEADAAFMKKYKDATGG